VAGVRRRLLLLSWTALVAGLLVGAVQVGTGPLSAPPASPSAWSTWLASRTEAEAVMALLRLVVVALAAYLLLVTALALVAPPVLPTPAFLRALVGTAAIGVLAAAPASATSSRVPPELRLLDPPAAAPVPPPGPAPPPRGTWVVEPGDHLWSIAERTAPGDVVRYWLALVEANRDRLADPDLVLPGQVLVLPDPA
jgi:nucleoid-associated protein YgaU